MKHITFFTMSLTKGGAERVIANMCNDYFSAKYQVSIITCMKAPVEYAINQEVKIYNLDQRENDYQQGMGKRFLRRQRILKEILQKIKPDILISFLPEPNFLCLSLKRGILNRKKFNFPMIISVRNDPKIEYNSTIRKVMMKYFYVKSDGYVFQTDQAKNYFSFSKHIVEASRVIPNPLSQIFLEDLPEENRGKVIINVGRLEKQKNQLSLIDAFAQLAEQNKDYTLEIYGEGTLREQLQQKIAEYHLQQRITLCGNVDDLITKMRGASLFVLSSLYEGMPNALMEAMALGLPVISTDCPCGGPGTLIKSGKNGILVPVNNTLKLTKALELMISDDDYAMKLGKQAKKIKQDFNPQQIFVLWDNYINDIYEHAKEID